MEHANPSFSYTYKLWTNVWVHRSSPRDYYKCEKRVTHEMRSVNPNVRLVTCWKGEFTSSLTPLIHTHCNDTLLLHTHPSSHHSYTYVSMTPSFTLTHLHATHARTYQWHPPPPHSPILTPLIHTHINDMHPPPSHSPFLRPFIHTPTNDTRLLHTTHTVIHTPTNNTLLLHTLSKKPVDSLIT